MPPLQPTTALSLHPACYIDIFDLARLAAAGSAPCRVCREEGIAKFIVTAVGAMDNLAVFRVNPQNLTVGPNRTSLRLEVVVLAAPSAGSVDADFHRIFLDPG